MHDVSSAEYHNKEIEISCIVCGKGVSPYCIPKRVQVICSKGGKYCSLCQITHNDVLDIEPINEDVLRFIDVSIDRHPGIIKTLLKVDCQFHIKVLEMQNVERIFVLPPVGRDRTRDNFAHISYYIGSDLEVNNTYRMTGYTTVEPKSQVVTHVFTKAVKLTSNIDGFNINRNLNDLNEFIIPNPTSDKIFTFLYKLYDHYAHNITYIYNRFDLHLSIDLVTKSALSFYFKDQYIHRGWLDVMIVGDTRCGKGFVSHKLADYYEIGEVVSGENCSFSGLVGGLHQVNGQWTTSWGRIPLNDRGFIIIDEAGEIKDWSRLSRLRSEGLAEIAKIRVQKTNSRTRILFLSNPTNRTIASYAFGIQSIHDIIRTPEDIARFDYLLVISHDEVPVEDINKDVQKIDKMFNRDLEKNLILWVWSREPDEVKFSNEAIDQIYRSSISLAKSYTFSIPLIQGENIRIKLARIAIAFAGRVFSNRENGKILYIDKVHVECASVFLNMIYKKECSGYLAYSKMRKDSHLDVMVEDYTGLDKYFNSFHKNKEIIYQQLLYNNTITDIDLSQAVNQDRVIVREMIHKLIKYGCITKRGRPSNTPAYIKTPSFTAWLKRKMNVNIEQDKYLPYTQ